MLEHNSKIRGPRVSFFIELKRRNVIRVAAAYVVTAWLIIQVVETIFPAFGYGDAAVRIATVVLAIGLVPTLILAWVFEWTSEGLKKEGDVDHTLPVSVKAGKRLDRIILVVLAVALAYFAFDKFVLEPARVLKIVEKTAQKARSDALVESYGEQSIAVLPFVNMSSDPEQEYFSDGISEELLNLLSKIPEFRVIARTSSFTFKGKDVRVPEIARQLNVAHVLEGSVRKAGNRVRITAQLIEARSDTHLWSETYDRRLDDIFAVQDEIAAAISAELELKLSDSGQRVLAEDKEIDPEIYDAYLRGMYLINQESMDDRKRGIEILEDVVDHDPQNALAYAGLGYGYAMLGHSPMPQWMSPASKLASQRALELDDSLAEAHLSVGSLKLYYEWDFSAAETHFRRAIELNPSLASAYFNLSYLVDLYGYPDEALTLAEQAVRLDPLSSATLVNTGALYWVRGRYQRALDYVEKTLQIDPENGFAKWLEAVVYRDSGQLDKAMDVASTIREDPAWGFTYGLVLARLGRDEEARHELEKLEGPPPHVLALVVLNAQLGENDEAIRWLKVIRDQMPHPWYPWLLGWWPDLDTIYDDPRVRELAEEIGLRDFR
jgi:TolB-like protein/Tfp pilus assembly protein PilF